MKDIINILKRKKLQLFFLFYILLLLPILSPMAQNITFWDKLAIFIVCGILFIAISIVSLFITSRLEKIIYSILLIISIIPGAIYLSYLLFAHVLLEQHSVISLFETNPDESKEFVAYYLSIWVIVGVLTYTAIPVVMIARMKSFKPLKVANYKTIFWTSIIAIVVIVGVERISRSVYFVTFYRTFVNYKIRVHHEIKTIHARQALPFQVTQSYNDTIPETYVVVVGESLTRHHLSLYGYPRRTSPLLEAKRDSNSLYVYKDITSPQVHTIPVIRSVLSMLDHEHPEYFTEKPSLFELFNRAGYETSLISNQDFSDKCRSSYDVVLTLAKNKYNLAPYKQHDDIVLAKFDQLITNKPAKKRLIFIHLIGNHMAYKLRYPKEYIRFNNQKDHLVPDAPFRNQEAKNVIDQYDNSVLYNDYIISSIINILNSKTAGKSVMIYFSDHGEEMYDYRDFAGHAYEKVTPPMCEIPFVVWMSDMYKEKRPDLVFDTNRPYSTEDFIYSISDIAGLNYEGYDDSRSLFSAGFKERERFVGDKTYKKILTKFSNH